MTKIDEDWSYDGLMLITIDYLPSPELGKNKIQFWENSPGVETDRSKTTKYFGQKSGKHNELLTDAATFVHNCEWVSSSEGDGKRVFKADKLTMLEAKQFFIDENGSDAVPFFAVHGFNMEPGVNMLDAQKGQNRLDLLVDDDDKEKIVIVPVLWPCDNFNHKVDKANATEAGVEIHQMLDQAMATTNIFPKKNLVCHSMGNFLLRRAANERLQFDNIFMVAADCNTEIFQKIYIAAYDENNDKALHYHDGLNILKMLKPLDKANFTGMLYCVHNHHDIALKVSSLGVGKERLGLKGVRSRGHCDEIKERYENYHVDIKSGLNPGPCHSYNWGTKCIAYYRQKLGL